MASPEVVDPYLFDKVVTVPDLEPHENWSADEIERLSIRPNEA